MPPVDHPPRALSFAAPPAGPGGRSRRVRPAAHRTRPAAHRTRPAARRTWAVAGQGRRGAPSALAALAGLALVLVATAAASATGTTGPGTSSAGGSSGSTSSGPGSGTGGPASSTTSYSLVTTTGGVIGFGGALSAATAGTNSPVVGAAPTPDGRGAWVAEASGAVVPLGDATSEGSMAGTPPAHPVVGVAGDAPTGGYWLVASDGGVFAFGAPFLGSTGAMHLNQPIVGMAATPDGQGYWLVAADGGIFSFGDATFYGSTGAMHLDQPIVGMAATPDGQGYWLVAADGGIFCFGDAAFWGSGAADHETVVGMVVDQGEGYQNPLRAVSDLQVERIDQGVDYGGAGPVYAIGDGVVTDTTNSGWPDGTFICYRLTDGPAAGDYVYVAENVQPAVTIGQSVTPSTVVGTLVDSSPGMETGWADPPGVGETMAMAAGQWQDESDADSVPTAFGANFSQLLASLGAPPGIENGTPTGTLPPDWPTW